MIDTLSRRAAIQIAVFIIVSSIGIALYPFPRGPAEYLWKHLTNALHFPGLFGLTLAALLFDARIERRPPRPFMWGALFTAFGGAIEIIQPLTGRDCSFSDLIHGALGAICASVGAALWQREKHRVALLWILFSAGLGIWIAKPLYHGYQIYRYEAEKFPQLFVACDPRDRVAWEIFPKSGKNRSSDSECGMTPLEVEDRYWGLRYMAAGRDWSPYHRLVLLVEARRQEILRVRIDDLEDTRAYKNRYNDSFALHVGKQAIAIPLEQIAAGPQDRALNLTEIGFLYLFSGNSTDPDTPTPMDVEDSGTKEVQLRNDQSPEVVEPKRPLAPWTLIGAHLE